MKSLFFVSILWPSLLCFSTENSCKNDLVETEEWTFYKENNFEEYFTKIFIKAGFSIEKEFSQKKFQILRHRIDSSLYADILVPKGVHFVWKSPYRKLLLKSLKNEVSKKDKNILILGVGSGLETIFIKRNFPHLEITATDIKIKALKATKFNFHYYYPEEDIKVIKSSLMDKIEGQYDLIIFNSPRVLHKKILLKNYSKSTIDKNSKRKKYRDPGFYDLDGVLYQKLLDQLPSHLSKRGRLLIMNDQFLPLITPNLFDISLISKTKSWSKDGLKSDRFGIFWVKPL